MITYIEYLGVPATVAIVIVAGLFLMQIVGLILDIKGKAVPLLMSIFLFFKKRKLEREENARILSEVKKLLSDVNNHYNEDNINKRNEWMAWVNARADVYDNSIVEINQKLDRTTQALENNTKVTEEMFVQTSRDRIIDFAAKVCDENAVVSREEFNRIFKIYKRYEEFLEERNMTNGEIDTNYRIIVEAYEQRVHNHSFAENIHGFE